jgi:hypothetical protein
VTEPPTITARRPSAVSNSEIQSLRPGSIDSVPAETCMTGAAAAPWFSTMTLRPSKPLILDALSSTTTRAGFWWIALTAAAAVVADIGDAAALATPSTCANWTAMTSGVPTSCWTSKNPSVSSPADQPSSSAKTISGRNEDLV